MSITLVDIIKAVLFLVTALYSINEENKGNTNKAILYLCWAILFSL